MIPSLIDYQYKNREDLGSKTAQNRNLATGNNSVQL